MNGMTVDEAVNNQIELGRLKKDLASVRDYLDATMGEGDADEALRPVQWALKDRATSRTTDSRANRG